jgi:putative transposase
LTERQRTALEHITRCSTHPQAQVLRARVLLHAAEGLNNHALAATLGLHVETPRLWRRRWAEVSSDLSAAEDDMDDATLLDFILTLLADEPRPGPPPQFNPGQICQIVAVACEDPTASGHPVTHWTPSELAREAVKRGIVDRISPRSVGRFLKRRPTFSRICRATG